MDLVRTGQLKTQAIPQASIPHCQNRVLQPSYQPDSLVSWLPWVPNTGFRMASSSHETKRNCTVQGKTIWDFGSEQNTSLQVHSALIYCVHSNFHTRIRNYVLVSDKTCMTNKWPISAEGVHCKRVRYSLSETEVKLMFSEIRVHPALTFCLDPKGSQCSPQW